MALILVFDCTAYNSQINQLGLFQVNNKQVIGPAIENDFH